MMKTIEETHKRTGSSKPTINQLKAISCQEVRNFLEAYIKGELSISRNFKISWHLKECQDCQERFLELLDKIG